MDYNSELTDYLKLNNIRLVERRIAGYGNHFEVHHQQTGSNHIRIIGEFMLSDEIVARMDGFNSEKVAELILKYTRDVVTTVIARSDIQNNRWNMIPTKVM